MKRQSQSPAGTTPEGQRSRNPTGPSSLKATSQKNKPSVVDKGASASKTTTENESFNRHYNKELRVSKDEIPIVMAELNDSAYQFIKRE